ncbi:uncharacterized protein LOC131693882 [Topomyia yanbarensis]|uniref:uncharacterized protein LOC131690656 n=1 Tax=Topomyia yanbarensis TaxID=2498891 RepID=UPI00273AA3B6|nr:uncharacterized protein LOC131690656 [Topomyia yanbarensis]XP_058838124.1 uncharacterized protein LOC131693882 [Topomyia yanbarensis]
MQKEVEHASKILLENDGMEVNPESETGHLEEPVTKLLHLEITPALQRCVLSGNNSRQNEICFESLNDISLNDDTKGKKFEVDYKMLYENEKKTSGQLHARIKKLSCALRNARRVNQWRSNTIAKKKRQIYILRNEVKRLRTEKSTDAKLLELLKSNTVVYNSMMNELKKPKGRRYNEQTKKFALGAYLAGPAAFRYVQSTEVLNLPSKMSIRRWNADVMIAPGLNDAILNRLAKKCKNFSKKERAVTICIDGMSIKQELVYNAKTDTFFGFPSDGTKRKIERNKPRVLATEAVVIMISGMCALEQDRLQLNKQHKGSRSGRFKQVIFNVNIVQTVD